MKTLTTYVVAALLVLGLCATPARAQGWVQATSTTLSAAITNAQTTMVVASATGFTVGNYAYLVGSNELVRIRVVNGTTITILRGQSGTFARAHPSAALVLTGVVNHFKQVDPDFNGICSIGNATPGLDGTYEPWVNVLNGNIWHCPTTSGAWAGTYRGNITFNSVVLTR